jgi:hypothetical protein
MKTTLKLALLGLIASIAGYTTYVAHADDDGIVTTIDECYTINAIGEGSTVKEEGLTYSEPTRKQRKEPRTPPAGTWKTGPMTRA